MTERPILFSAPMVSAILAGNKTQTRRAIKKPMVLDWLDQFLPEFVAAPENHLCPYGHPGDRLWVRERHCYLDVTKSATSGFPLGPQNGNERGLDIWNLDIEYSDGTERSTSVEGEKPKQTRERGETRWRPGIHMPRWACRLVLEVTGVRIERLNTISEDDARAEGVGPLRADGRMGNGTPASDGFADLWESINGAKSWDANPWVWVVEFRRVNA